MFRTALLGLAGAAAIQATPPPTVTHTVVPSPTTKTVYTGDPTESSSSVPPTITLTVTPNPTTTTVVGSSTGCEPITTTLTDYSSTTSYVTKTYSTSYPVTVTSDHTVWTTDKLTVTKPVTEVFSHVFTTTTTDHTSTTSYVTTTHSTGYPVTVTSNQIVWTTDVLTVTKPVTERPSDVSTKTVTTSHVTTTLATSYPVTVTNNHTVWITDKLTLTTPVTLTETSTFLTSVTRTTTEVPSFAPTLTVTKSVPLPTSTEDPSFEIPEFEFTRAVVCPDWKRHYPGEWDEPWALYLIQNDIYYGENLRLMGNHLVLNMDLFDRSRDYYLANMLSHPRVLESTLKVVDDMDCVMKGVRSVYDELDPQNKKLMKWRRRLEFHLWKIFGPREQYEGTIPTLLEKLQDTKKRLDSNPQD